MAEAALVASRNQANLRSIARSDPAVLEIYETSVFATIYHYVVPEGNSGGDGDWVKQKAEGPTFIVRRSKTPEYAIYILNRASVKNITIPLVRGEMKATPVGDTMLQVARRGEKVKRGIWFSEPESIPRFREQIIRICGQPSARPDSALLAPSSRPASASPGQNPPTVSPPTTATSVDGFSRLFAGIMTAQGGSSSPTQAPSIPSASIPPPIRPMEIAQADLPQTVTSRTTTIVNTSSTSTATQADQPQSFSGPPGQTVDDLLNSILGVTSFPPRPLQESTPPNGSSSPAAALPPPAISAGQVLPPPETAPPIPVSTKAIPPPADMPTPHHLPPHLGGPPSHISPHLRHQSPAHQQPSTPVPREVIYTAALHESVLDGLGGVRDLRSGGKEGFVVALQSLLHNEPAFVEDLWQGYLRRIHQAGG